MFGVSSQPDFLTLSQELYFFEQQGSQLDTRHSETDPPDALFPPMPPLVDSSLLTFVPFQRDTINPRSIDPALPPPEPQTDQAASGETSGNQTATSSSVEESSSSTPRLARVIRRNGRITRTQKASQAVFEERKEKNRLNSQKLRAEKKEYVIKLEREHAELTQQNGSLKGEIESIKKQLEASQKNHESFFQQYDGQVQNTFHQLLAERQKLLDERQKFFEFFSKFKAVQKP